MAKPKIILIVCTGNICRSPMAEALLRAKLEAIGQSNAVWVRSAGLYASHGQPASPFARQVIRSYDLDISGHRSTQLRQEDIDRAAVILVMTQRHAWEIGRWFAGDAEKVHLISELVGQSEDIDDPYGGSLTEYAAVATRLATIIHAGGDTLLRWLEQAGDNKKGTGQP